MNKTTTTLIGAATAVLAFAGLTMAQPASAAILGRPTAVKAFYGVHAVANNITLRDADDHAWFYDRDSSRWLHRDRDDRFFRDRDDHVYFRDRDDRYHRDWDDRRYHRDQDRRFHDNTGWRYHN